MRKLIYILDGARKLDFEDETIMNPYRDLIFGYCNGRLASLEVFPHYYSSYTDFKNSIISFLNGNENCELMGNSFLKWTELKNIPTKRSKFINLAELLDIKVRCTEVNNTNSLSNIQGSEGFPGLLGEVRTIEEFLNDTEPNCIDFILDTSIRDAQEEFYKEIPDYQLRVAFSTSKNVLNEQLFSKYDDIYILSLYGYETDQDNLPVEGDTISQENRPVLMHISNHFSGVKPESRVLARMDYITQADLLKYIFYNILPVHDHLILYNYSEDYPEYPTDIYLIRSNREMYYFDMSLPAYNLMVRVHRFNNYSEEWEEVDIDMNEQLWSILYTESQFIKNQFEYSYINKLIKNS
jgi:hypothetical protein